MKYFYRYFYRILISYSYLILQCVNMYVYCATLNVFEMFQNTLCVHMSNNYENFFKNISAKMHYGKRIRYTFLILGFGLNVFDTHY